jgi:hypothetical protein
MPTFETQQDIDNEYEVLREFLNSRDEQFKWMKLPKWELDYMVTDEKDEKLLCFLEIKCYTRDFDETEKQMISMIKYNKMLNYNRIAPTYFLAKYKCGTLAYIHVSNICGKIGWGGRANRGGANDTEKMVWCPKDKFKIID